MPPSNRRQFLRHTALWSGVATLGSSPWLRAAGTTKRLRLALIGPGGMGMNHLRALAGSPDLELAWVCDPDAERLGTAAREVEQRSGRAPQTASDLRRVLADSSVHAVIIATPDHWHVPAALLALSAGKHVYVEKPCSHNIREGRLLVDAARRAGRVVQIGTQSRSSDTIREAMQRLHDGAIGEVLVAKAWNSQLRANIGHASPAEPPPHLDFDLWLGPAPRVPYQANLLPSTWRWFTAFGCGDAGNDGVHELDLARWGLGVETHPRRMAALGGKSFFDDDQQFPDTQYVAFEYEIAGRTRQLVYEHRIWSPYVQEGYENGNAFYGTKGMMLLGKQSGWQLFGPRNQPVEERRGGLSLAPHHGNFFEAIRTGQRPHADAETGHLSAALAHFANLATRLGVTLAFDPRQERFVGNEDANRFLGRTYRDGHWAAPSDAG